MHFEMVGRIHPSDGDLGLDENQLMTTVHPTWTVAVSRNSVVVIIDTENDVTDLGTFVNDVRSVVTGIVDSIGFTTASPLRFELTHIIINGSEIMFVHPGWPAILNAEPGETDVETSRTELIQTVSTVPLIRYAVADVQRAIESPDDTAFYCYRAVESIRRMFLVGGDRGAARRESWEVLRATMNISETEARTLKDLADGRRHGGHRVLDEAARLQCILLARRAIRAAVATAKPQ